MNTRRMGITAGSIYTPQTRIRRRGKAISQKLKMRAILKKIAIYVAILFASCLGYVWTRVQVVEVGYRLRQLEDKQEKLKEENRSLLVESATLKSPQRLEQLASQWGLSRPTENQVVYIQNHDQLKSAAR